MSNSVQQAAATEIAKHRRLLRSGRGGRILSALMLPQLWLATPAGYGVLTTTGRARSLICDTVFPNDYGECALHLRGLPTRTKVQELHRYWFETGIPIVIDLKEIRQ